MQQDISIIVFDLGNVLLPFNYQTTVTKLEDVEKGLGYQFLRFYQDNYQYHREFERGDMSADEFVGIMLGALNNKIDKNTFCEYYSHIFSENKEVVDLLPKLKKSFTLVLLSNTNIIHYEYGWKQYAFLKHFEKIVVSYEAGAVKPETKIYKTVETFTQRKPGEHFFIDDIPEYITAARKLGWNGVQFKGYKSLLVELINQGILRYRD
ncbi:MAG TPA: HAD family phosphatase [Ignavibacteriaceae bacterium]|jgi:HAD superfamily hydrolase (TIGR01509 family)|nr:HAD family phosphatase [Ignavibacteriaceae bacterium]